MQENTVAFEHPKFNSTLVRLGSSLQAKVTYYFLHCDCQISTKALSKIDQK